MGWATNPMPGRRPAVLGLAALIAGSLAGCVATGGAPGPKSSAPAGNVTGGLGTGDDAPAVRVVRQHVITRAGHPATVGYGAGSLWLAFYPPRGGLGSGPSGGELLRVDPGDGTVVSHWPVGGSPVSVSAAAQRVWVANGPGLGAAPTVAANQVMEFTAQGQLVHTYPIANPIATAASADGAWAQYLQPDGIYLQHLHDGTADPAIKLAATAPALSSSVVVCADGRVYAATFDTDRQKTHVQQFGAQAQPLGHTVLTAAGPTTLACQARGVAALIVDHDDGYLFPLPFTTPPAPPGSIKTRPGWLVADSSGDAVWLVAASTDTRGRTQVQRLDRQGLAAAPPAVLAPDTLLASAGGSQLWTVHEHLSTPDTTVITGVEAP